MKKILIFTGAGMSVPLGLPTTTDFMTAVNNGIGQITQYIVEYLGSSGGDIEWLLSTLESFKSETALTEFLLTKIKTSHSSNPHIQEVSKIFESQISSFRSQAASEIIRIKKIIFDQLSQYQPEKALALYLNLIKEIKENFGDVALSIITTNYDLTFETAIESYQSEWITAGINDVDFGFSIQFGRPIYNPSKDFNWDSTIIEYLKIHGSVDWHRDARGKCSRSMSSTVPDDPDQMAILYPGFKGVPELEPFISMHGRLNTRLAEADLVIVIGFAFRDTYINSIFENILRIRKDLEILYFNPVKIDKFPKNSLVPYLTNNYYNFRHIERGIEVSEKSLQLETISLGGSTPSP